jgi:hypothetical protein
VAFSTIYRNSLTGIEAGLSDPEVCLWQIDEGLFAIAGDKIEFAEGAGVAEENEFCAGLEAIGIEIGAKFCVAVCSDNILTGGEAECLWRRGAWELISVDGVFYFLVGGDRQLLRSSVNGADDLGEATGGNQQQKDEDGDLVHFQGFFALMDYLIPARNIPESPVVLDY